MELYTSLTHLKLALSGHEPPMTPLSREAKKYIDEAFVLGLGGLQEIYELGLRCPLRKCGQYHHNLYTHLRRSHQASDIDLIRRLLDIPKTASLMSQRMRERRKSRWTNATPEQRKRQGRILAVGYVKKGRIKVRGRKVRAKMSKRQSESTRSMTYKNRRGWCIAQLKEKLQHLFDRNGQSPTSGDVERYFGRQVTKEVYKVFGSWPNALRACKLPLYNPHDRSSHVGNPLYTRDSILTMLMNWYEEHGDLPTQGDAEKRRGAVLITGLPVPPTVMKHLGIRGWPEAMRYAAKMLGIQSARYSARRKAA